MKLTTKSKFTILLATALGLLAAATGVYTTVSVSDTLSRQLEASSRNAVLLSANNVRDRQQELFNDKLGQALQIQGLMRLYERLVTRLADDGQERERALRNVALPEGMTLWALDPGLRTLLVNGDMPADCNPYAMNDIKGREVGQNSLRLSRAGIPATAMVTFPRPNGKPRVYFGRHFYVRKWEAMVGLWMDLEPDKAIQERDLRQAVLDMQESFQRIRIGPTGFLFVADLKGDLIIRPGEWDLSGALKAVNPGSGNLLIDDVRNGAGEMGQPVYALLPAPGGGQREALIYVSYFRPYKWLVAGVNFIDEIKAPGRNLSLSLLGVILAATCLLTLGAMLFINKLTRPLVKLTHYARRLPQTDFFGEPEDKGLLQKLALNRHGDEIEDLANAFLFMDGALRSRVRELVDSAGSRERMAGELQAATGIQMGFLPKPLPEEVSRGRFELAASLVPAREVGGDLYDFFMLDDDRLCLVIGDVSDKGVSAALFMSMTMVLIRAGAAAARGPEEILDLVNANLARENVSNMFVTLFIAFLDLSSGGMVYANGGHNPPFLRGAGGVRTLDEIGGMMLGVFVGPGYSRAETRLEPGETLLLYTDGLTEAMNGQSDVFGDAAARQALLACPSAAPEAVLRGLGEAVREHVAGAPASDDLTLLCLRYQGANKG